ncbi:hypothetical protein P8C59_003918 [Phyllachora maydis]|uniref:Uncharacterized protein n=1 Tax=Phyllachora maydis TaxID=1825666 RepID=A0AAD9I2N6_9PEZI|nr:hypothetical protein P8C59_003918 [Phyllachora maydis]
MPFDSKGLIAYIRILLEQATTLWYKEEVEKEAVYKVEITIYKVRLSKPAKHALPISPAIKKAADTGSSNSKFVV